MVQTINIASYRWGPSSTPHFYSSTSLTLSPLSTQNVLSTVRVFVQQQQHTRAYTQTRIAYSLLYVFERHPTTKYVWHNNHESRQRLWTPISKSCDSFLFTFAPDVRRRHLYRRRLTNVHTYTQAHAQAPTVLLIYKVRQRETKWAQEWERAPTNEAKPNKRGLPNSNGRAHNWISER